MLEAALAFRGVPVPPPEKAVAAAVRAWFVIALAGQWIFLAYILAVLYPPIAQHGATLRSGV